MCVDGATLYTGSYDNTVRVWDMSTLELISVLDAKSGGHSSKVSCLYLNIDVYCSVLK